MTWERVINPYDPDWLEFHIYHKWTKNNGNVQLRIWFSDSGDWHARAINQDGSYAMTRLEAKTLEDAEKEAADWSFNRPKTVSVKRPRREVDGH